MNVDCPVIMIGGPDADETEDSVNLSDLPSILVSVTLDYGVTIAKELVNREQALTWKVTTEKGGCKAYDNFAQAYQQAAHLVQVSKQRVACEQELAQWDK